mgnify:FL=1
MIPEHLIGRILIYINRRRYVGRIFKPDYCYYVSYGFTLRTKGNTQPLNIVLEIFPVGGKTNLKIFASPKNGKVVIYNLIIPNDEGQKIQGKYPITSNNLPATAGYCVFEAEKN